MLYGETDPQAFADMAVDLHATESVDETVQVVLEYALKAVSADAAGVTFVHPDSRIETVAATDPLVARLDDVQRDTGEGPDLAVLDEGGSVIVADAESEDRWPAWSRAVQTAGIHSYLGVRLSTRADVIGTLNLYGRGPAQFDRDDAAVAHVIARHAAVALSAARTEAQLALAIDARKTIGQAQGILMERFDMEPEQAFAVLRRFSQERNTKLRDVAQQLVESRRLPGD